MKHFEFDDPEEIIKNVVRKFPHNVPKILNAINLNISIALGKNKTFRERLRKQGSPPTLQLVNQTRKSQTHSNYLQSMTRQINLTDRPVQVQSLTVFVSLSNKQQKRVRNIQFGCIATPRNLIKASTHNLSVHKKNWKEMWHKNNKDFISNIKQNLPVILSINVLINVLDGLNKEKKQQTQQCQNKTKSSCELYESSGLQSALKVQTWPRTFVHQRIISSSMCSIQKQRFLTPQGLIKQSLWWILSSFLTWWWFIDTIVGELDYTVRRKHNFKDLHDDRLIRERLTNVPTGEIGNIKWLL